MPHIRQSHEPQVMAVGPAAAMLGAIRHAEVMLTNTMRRLAQDAVSTGGPSALAF